MNYSIKKISIFSLIFFTHSLLNAQLVINEVSSNSTSLVMDEDGDFEDWIEIYNAGGASVDLAGYSLLDNLPAPQQWFFPSFNLAPNAHVLIHASGKNKKEVIDHWETAVKENDFWKYLIPSSEPAASWKEIGYDDALWTTAKGGFGYGDGDDTTVLASPLTSVFLRRTFTISDTSKISRALLHLDYDDGFVAYLNGVEIARANLTGNPPAYNTLTDLDREAQVYGGGQFESFPVSSTTLKALLVNGTNVLAIQAHNVNPSSSDFSIRPYLSFGMKDAGIQFSSVPAWFNAPVSSFHTNFKLSKDGNETLYLLDNASVIIDQKLLPVLRPDHSFGRQPDGSATWKYFNIPTPGSTNNAASGYLGYCTDVLVFSIDGGFYSSGQTLSISGSSNIRYTTNGSEPTISSALYTGPISIPSTRVIRAACISADYLPRKVFTNTYFINDNSTLPVVSISTHPDNFFDYNTGIYVLGPNAEAASPHFGANYWQDWERPVHIEFFDKQRNLGFEQDAGIKIFGNYSRANAMKSLWIKAHDKYEKNRIDYKFFADKNINSFKEIILRNSGNDFNQTHIKDGLNHTAVSKKTDIDVQAYRPCVVYINGQYWGVHNIREKVNEHYVEQNHGIDKDDIDLADAWGGALQGENNIWGLWWMSQNTNLSTVANFALIADSFDLENMVDYFAAEIYISNWDWPQNNLKLWRPRTGDRKFRYLLYDTDISLGLWNIQPASFNQMGRVKNATGLSAGPHAEIFSSMLNYTPFRNYFINRSADLMNTIYTPANFKNLANRLRDTIAPEMARHFSRWGSNIWNWAGNIEQMTDFMDARPAYARSQIRSVFGLVKQVNVTLNVSPAGAGFIKINTIYPDTYPWTGVYFDGVPVTITAVPNPGYSFSHWQSTNLIPSPNANKSVTLNVNQVNETFTAYFTGSSAPTKITVSEINYNSSLIDDTGDWIELYNYGTAAVDISNWILKDEKDYHAFIFPSNTIIQSGKRLVVCSDTVKFKSVFPTVNNFIGQPDFSFSNNGDQVRLYDFRGNLYLSFVYDDNAPWPIEPDGGGYTLELIDPLSNLNSSTNWFAGCLGGSPGHGYSSACILSNKDSTLSDNKFILFPNPAKGKFKILINYTFLENTELKIINSKGQEIYNKNISSGSVNIHEEIDLSGNNAGLYFVLLTTENGVESRKLILE